jgi:hypothetical protein
MVPTRPFVDLVAFTESRQWTLTFTHSVILTEKQIGGSSPDPDSIPPPQHDPMLRLHWYKSSQRSGNTKKNGSHVDEGLLSAMLICWWRGLGMMSS